MGVKGLSSVLLYIPASWWLAAPCGRPFGDRALFGLQQMKKHMSYLCTQSLRMWQVRGFRGQHAEGLVPLGRGAPGTAGLSQGCSWPPTLLPSCPAFLTRRGWPVWGQLPFWSSLYKPPPCVLLVKSLLSLLAKAARLPTEA